MPTPISHVAVGFAIAAWGQQGVPSRRVFTVAAICAALPDIDVIAWPLRPSPSSLLAHRAITHSLAFALVAAAVAAAVFFREEQWAERRRRLFLILGLALFSHSCLDALSTYSRGVAFLAPFTMQRYRFLWTPLGDPSGRIVAAQLGQEALVVLLPAVLIGWLGMRRASAQ